jgi:hypothetical protein
MTSKVDFGDTRDATTELTNLFFPSRRGSIYFKPILYLKVKKF